MDDVWTDWQTDGWTSAHGHRWSHTFVRTTAFVLRRRSRSWSTAPIGQRERWQGWHLPCFWLVERCEASHLPRLLLAAALRGSFSPEQYGREESNNITNMPSAPSQFCQDKRVFIKNLQIQYCEIITLLWSLNFGKSLKRSITVSLVTKNPSDDSHERCFLVWLLQMDMLSVGNCFLLVSQVYLEWNQFT